MFAPEDRVRRSQTVVGEGLRDEYLVLDLGNGRYYGLDGVARFVWDRLDGTTTVEEIASAVVESFEVDLGRAREDVLELLGQLEERGLVETGEAR